MRSIGRVSVLSAGIVALASCAYAANANASTGKIAHSARHLTTVKFVTGAAQGESVMIPYGYYHGIFKKYGINLEMYWNGGNSQNSAQLVASNDFQLSETSPTAMMAAYEGGLKTEAIFGYLQLNPIAIIVNKSLGIKKPSQLVGKTISVGSGTAAVAIAATFLKHYGLNENEVNVIQVPIPEQAPGVGTKKVDGTVGFPFAMNPSINALGVKTTSLYVSKAGINEIYQQWAVGDTWANAHVGAVKGLVKALLESTLGAMAHPQVAVRDLIKAAPQEAPTFKISMAVWLGAEKFLSTPDDKGHPFGWQSPKDWAQTLAFGENFLGVKPMNLSSLYTNKYLPANDPLVH